MPANHVLAMKLNGQVNQLADRIVRQAHEQFSLKAAIVPPGEDSTAAVNECLMGRGCRFLVVISQNGSAVAQGPHGCRTAINVVWPAASGINESNTVRGDGNLVLTFEILIQSPQEADFGCPLTDDNRCGQKRIGVQANGSLNSTIAADFENVMVAVMTAYHTELMAPQLPECDRGMRCQERLKRLVRFLCAESPNSRMMRCGSSPCSSSSIRMIDAV